MKCPRNLESKVRKPKDKAWPCVGKPRKEKGDVYIPKSMEADVSAETQKPNLECSLDSNAPLRLEGKIEGSSPDNEVNEEKTKKSKGKGWPCVGKADKPLGDIYVIKDHEADISVKPITVSIDTPGKVEESRLPETKLK